MALTAARPARRRSLARQEALWFYAFVSPWVIGFVLWVAGPMRMTGYWQAESSTRDVFRGSWLRTGDLTFLDEAGVATVVGRSADVISRGGEKIHASQFSIFLLAIHHIPVTADEETNESKTGVLLSVSFISAK